MGFKERLSQMKESAERQRQAEAEEKRRNEAVVLAESSRYPKVEEVEAQKLENIVQIANNNVLAALRDFGEVMWGAEKTDVGGVRNKEDYTWFAADKSSYILPEQTSGWSRFHDYSGVSKVSLRVLSVPESSFLKEQSRRISFYHGSDSQTKGKRDVQKDYGDVKWEHAFGWLRPAASFMDERLGSFDYCAVMSVGGIEYAEKTGRFGFDAQSYLEKLERGFEVLVRRPNLLSCWNEPQPFRHG